GVPVWSATYSAYGVTQIDVERVVSQVRFSGQYHDDETGFFYNWHRYYDPDVGRYLSTDPLGSKTRLSVKDPIGFRSDRVNLYRYVFDDPINSTDPNGMEVKICTRRSLVVPCGNHVYFWDTRTNQTCAKQGFSGMGNFSNPENGPNGDICVTVPNSEGNEDQLM